MIHLIEPNFCILMDINVFFFLSFLLSFFILGLEAECLQIHALGFNLTICMNLLHMHDQSHYGPVGVEHMNLQPSSLHQTIHKLSLHESLLSIVVPSSPTNE